MDHVGGRVATQEAKNHRQFTGYFTNDVRLVYRKREGRTLLGSQQRKRKAVTCHHSSTSEHSAMKLG